MTIETWMENDSGNLIPVNLPGGNLYQGDDGANLIGVKLSKDGNPVEVSGDVSGRIIKPDGEVITCTGNYTDEGNPYIILPQEAYSTPGRLLIQVKVDGTTIGAMEATVYPAFTESIIGGETDGSD